MKGHRGSRLLDATDFASFAEGYIGYVQELLQGIDTGVLDAVRIRLLAAADTGATVFVAGNGGSATAATHFANDLANGLSAPDAPSLRAVSLSANEAAVTALANDQGYERIFVAQLEGVMQADDVLMAISASGASANVVHAATYARRVGATVIACTGFDGGPLRQLASFSLHVPTLPGEYGPTEDVFQALLHLLYTFMRVQRRGL